MRCMKAKAVAMKAMRAMEAKAAAMEVIKAREAKAAKAADAAPARKAMIAKAAEAADDAPARNAMKAKDAAVKAMNAMKAEAARCLVLADGFRRLKPMSSDENCWLRNGARLMLEDPLLLI